MITWTVSFINAAGSGFSAGEIAAIEDGVIAAGEEWSRYFTGPGATLEVVVDLKETGGASCGGSLTSVFLGVNGASQNVFQQGAVQEIASGIDPNAADGDVIICMPRSYFLTLFVDPDPAARTAALPPVKLDMQSVLLHEIGHALGFNGWSVNAISTLPSATGISTYEDDIHFVGADPFLSGANAVAVYGSDVPVTNGPSNNSAHIGNQVGGVGDDLIADLMNGIVFVYSVRYHVSALDIAILADAGASIAVPTSGDDALWGFNAIDPALAAAQTTPIAGFLLGHDAIAGGGGADSLYGLSGDDELMGGDGDDRLTGGDGSDSLVGGGGFDSVSYAECVMGVSVNLTTGAASGGAAGDVFGVDIDVSDIEAVIGSRFSDTITGTGASAAHGVDIANLLSGMGGNDSLLSLSGDDTLLGGAGDDTMDGGLGDDTIGGEGGRDVMRGDDGADTLHGFGSHDSLYGGNGDDDLRGGFGKDNLNGSGSNDVLRGFEGDDRLFGGAGSDTLFGNAENDQLFGGGGGDRLKGDAGNDTLNGSFGSDTLTGGAGDDLIEFRKTHGADTIDDFVAGAASEDVVNLIAFGAAFDSFAEVMAAASDDGTDTTIDFGGGDMLILKGVLVTDLHAGDFAFG